MVLGRALAVAILALGAMAIPACSSVSGDAPTAMYRSTSIERPAGEIGDEDAPLEKAGKVMVAVLVVGVALVAIALPFLLFL